MGDHADDTMDCDLEAADFIHGDGDESDQRLMDYIRGRRPRFTSSTYDPNSKAAKLGAEAERIVLRELDILAQKSDRNTWVYPWADLKFEHGFAVAIHNSQNGDIYVVGPTGTIIRSIEVKTSLEYVNASISNSELLESKAEYLVALTTAGLWCCTMDEARRHAREVKTATGSFWLVPRDRVKLSELSEVLR